MGKIQESFNDIFDNLFSPNTPDVPEDEILETANEDAAVAAEAERRRRNQTQVKRSGSVSDALSAAIGKTTLGGL
jgi:hypothetical protein